MNALTRAALSVRMKPQVTRSLRSIPSSSLILRQYSTIPNPAETPPAEPKKPLSLTGQFYRDLIPSMLQCLAFAWITFYSLQLLHNTLENEFIIEDLGTEVKRLEADVENLKNVRSIDTPSVIEQSKRWWKFW